MLYDVVIIGAGASGLTTGLYTARAGLKTLILERGIYGGQIQTTAEIENYSGFEGVISGEDLSEQMYNQAISQGVEYTYGDVQHVSKEEDGTFTILRIGKDSIKAKSVVIATGVQRRVLEVDGESKLTGRGVAYCAICDGAFFKGKDVIVVGGGDSALEESVYLSQIVNSVTLVHRADKFNGQKVLQDRAVNNPKITTLMNTEVISIHGDKKVESVTLLNNKDNTLSSMHIDGVFIYIGSDANTEIFKELIEVDENGFIITNEDMMTSMKGVFAVGDVRSKNVRQIATAVGDGAIAGVNIGRYLEEIK